MLELDLLLVPFFDEMFETLPRELQQAFIKLLEQDDPDLLIWFSRRGHPDDPELKALVCMILGRVQPADD